jgi:hypothetical protein
MDLFDWNMYPYNFLVIDSVGDSDPKDSYVLGLHGTGSVC